jgi:ABC-type nickel/cobalt efflux system permease component RcnA
VKKFKRLFWSCLVCLGAVAGLRAHPLGNFTVSHYAQLQVEAQRLNLRYIVECAEISTAQEWEGIDTNGNRALEQAEKDAYAARKAQLWAQELFVTIDGERIPLSVQTQQISLLSGDGGLPLLRVEAELTGTFAATNAVRKLRFADRNATDRSGWREIVVVPQAGIAIFDSTAFGNSLSQELKLFPPDPLAQLLHEQTAEFSFTLGAAPAGTTPLQTREGQIVTPKQRDRLAELIAAPELTWATMLLGLLLATLLGGLHAMSPGHGKTIVGAYLIGSRGTVWHAAFLGLTVTITHTVGVFLLGIVTLFGQNYFVPEKFFPLLSLLSGLIVVVIGGQQLLNRWGKQRGSATPSAHQHTPEELAANGFTHSHGGSTHSHLPPVRATWRNLLALGISGGLLPCPSALVVLLSAIALHRVGYGLLLVFAFSLGLAAVLTAVGLLFLYARRFVERPAFGASSRLMRGLPVLSAAVIVCAGVTICLSALAQQGWLQSSFLTILQ